jgi:hypothetical protein
MAPRNKVPYFTKLDPELREALRRYKAAIGVPEAEQIDRALREWLGARRKAWAPRTARRKLGGKW